MAFARGAGFGRGYFRRRSFPHLVLGLLLGLAGLSGFLGSWLMLLLGVHQMWISYPVAVVLAYGLLLALIRLRVEVENSRFDPDHAELREALKSAGNDTDPEPEPQGRRG